MKKAEPHQNTCCKSLCSQLRPKRPRTHQDKRRRVPSYDESIQGHPSKKERERESERQRKRKRKRRREKGTDVPSYETSVQGHTKLKSFDCPGHHLCHAKMAGYFDRCGHVLACSRAACLNLIVRQILANNFGTRLLCPLRTALYPGSGYGRHTPVRRGHRAPTEERHTWEMHTD